MSRNSQWGSWNGGNWNIVFSGCINAPQSHCSNHEGHPFTTIGETPKIAEKPYITESDNKWTLQVPNVETNKRGPTVGWVNSKSVDFSEVYVAQATNSAATITSKLDSGMHVVLQPG